MLNAAADHNNTSGYGRTLPLRMAVDRGAGLPSRRLPRQVLRDTDLADYPHAVDVRSNVLVYSAPKPRQRIGARCGRS